MCIFGMCVNGRPIRRVFYRRKGQRYYTDVPSCRFYTNHRKWQHGNWQHAVGFYDDILLSILMSQISVLGFYSFVISFFSFPDTFPGSLQPLSMHLCDGSEMSVASISTMDRYINATVVSLSTGKKFVIQKFYQGQLDDNINNYTIFFFF